MRSRLFAVAFGVQVAAGVGLPGAAEPAPAGTSVPVVRISSRDARYLETAEGRPFVPNGLNVVYPSEGQTAEASLAQLEGHLDQLAAHGGNFVRMWAGHAFFEPEIARQGAYDPERLARLERLVRHAAERGLAVKLTLESFRNVQPDRRRHSKWIYHREHGGSFASLTDFLASPAGQEAYLARFDAIAARLAPHGNVVIWELWNEMNVIHDGDWLTWTRTMLPRLKARAPDRLVTQSLGSWDRPLMDQDYAAALALPDNELAQVHRYLDEGAPAAICQAPVDVLVSDAVRRAREIAPERPVLLAESGAVAPQHTGPHALLAKDRYGTILHDVLFAAFFSGAAGPGHTWWCDPYVASLDLWWHYGRFARATAGVDYPGEGIRPLAYETEDGLRVYALRGRSTTLAWVRDGRTGWREELAEGRPAEPRRGLTLSASALLGGRELADGDSVVAYDPWTDREQPIDATGDRLILPEFTRSLVIRVRH